MQTIEQIKKLLVKQAVELTTGGFKPTNSMTESWVGRVYLYKADEEIPLDNHGDLMIPVFQLCLDDLPLIPDVLKDTRALTVFIAKDLPMDLTPNGENWLIREYRKTDKLTVKDLANPDSWIKPFPLKPQIVAEDYPVWDGGGIPGEIAAEILALEDSGAIDDYFDVTENHYGHKVGGYPSFCQPGIDFGEGFEFVMQIASDDKAHLNIVDSGTIFLAKNAQTGAWKYYCDFH